VKSLVLAICLAMLVLGSDAYGEIPSKYRRDLIRNARLVFGLGAPTSTFAAQIHAESGGRANVCSRRGACGLAQFMPRTAKAMSRRYPALGPAAPLNPIWSMRAMLHYDWEIWSTVYVADPCARMRHTLIGYNGGPRRIYAKQLPRETQRYIHRILVTLEPAYIANGWGLGSCNARTG
jgi:soluble lytic murein transglycosylase-like protein